MPNTKNISNNTRNLIKFLSQTKNVKNKCNQCSNSNTCNRHLSKGQTVIISRNKNFVLKSSLDKESQRVENVNNKTIKLDNTTMNLLIQTIIKEYLSKTPKQNKNIEHYYNLCSSNGKITLVSKKANYPDYLTLEDYIQACLYII